MIAVDDNDFARLDMVSDDGSCSAICLAESCGRGEGIGRTEGCSHLIGWGMWEGTV